MSLAIPLFFPLTPWSSLCVCVCVFSPARRQTGRKLDGPKGVCRCGRHGGPRRGARLLGSAPRPFPVPPLYAPRLFFFRPFCRPFASVGSDLAIIGATGGARSLFFFFSCPPLLPAWSSDAQRLLQRDAFLVSLYCASVLSLFFFFTFIVCFSPHWGRDRLIYIKHVAFRVFWTVRKQAHTKGNKTPRAKRSDAKKTPLFFPTAPPSKQRDPKVSARILVSILFFLFARSRFLLIEKGDVGEKKKESDAASYGTKGVREARVAKRPRAAFAHAKRGPRAFVSVPPSDAAWRQ